MSTHRRAFGTLRDQDELQEIDSALGVRRTRYDRHERKDFTVGILSCELVDVKLLNVYETATTGRFAGIRSDNIAIARGNAGSTRVEQVHGDSFEYTAGDVFATSFERAFTSHTADFQDFSVIWVPSLRLRQLGIPEQAFEAKADFTPLGRTADILFDLFHSFAKRVDAGPSLSQRALATINESIVGLAAATLEENVVAAGPTLRSKAEAFIDVHLHELRLSPETVASGLHVSKRTLYRSFANADQTVASFILATRLRRVRRELDAEGTAVNIGEVARRWGFANAGYFAKLFQNEFGCSPSEYLRGRR